MAHTLVEFIRSGLRQLHQDYQRAIADLSLEQMHWRANEHGCHVAFVLWHYYRTQDNITLFVAQRKPTVWLDGGWDGKFGLDRKAQGTGMSREEAQTLRLNSKEEFQKYMDTVASASDAFLATLDDEALERPTTVKPLGDMPLRNALGTMCLTHGCTHLGEIQHLRGLMGLQGTAY